MRMMTVILTAFMWAKPGWWRSHRHSFRAESPPQLLGADGGLQPNTPKGYGMHVTTL